MSDPAARRRDTSGIVLRLAARLVVMLFVVLSLLRYTSWSNRRVMGRWSEAHFLLIVLAVVVCLLVLFRTWRRRGAATVESPRERLARVLAGAGVFLWAAALFVDSVSDARAGGRVADLALFAGAHPAAMLLEWLALPCLFAAAVAAVADTVRRRYSARRGAWWPAALLMLGSVTGLLVLMEGATRVVNVVHPLTRGFPTKSNGLWERRFVSLNSLGYRDREPAPAPEPGTRRILLVGDSYAFGWGIADPRDRVGERLAEGLNRQANGPRFEVVNAARPDTHTLHHIEILRRMAPYRPDHVLLLYVFNDIEHVTGPPVSAVMNPQGRSAQWNPLRLLIVNSHLAEQAFLRTREIAYRYLPVAAESNFVDPYTDPATLEPHLQALARFFALCRETRAEGRLIPFDVRVPGSTEASARYRDFVKRLGERDIPVWPIADAFRGHPYRDLTVNSLDPHPSVLAHRLAAEAILERFRAPRVADARGASGGG